MIPFLKNHPFAVEAFFERSLVITFAIPKLQLQNFIPECLTLDTFQNQWAFIAVALVQTNGLRPKGFPKILGNDFFLIGYRIFVRYTNKAGKRLRGLYTIKSETDQRQMEILGNIFTHYNYTTTDIQIKKESTTETIQSTKSKFNVTIEQTNQIHLPHGSPFTDWKTARRFAGPLPHTFTYNEKKGTVLIIKGIRQNWIPQPVQVINYHFDFLNQLKIPHVILASAFQIEKIPYVWEKGKLEKWK